MARGRAAAVLGTAALLLGAALLFLDFHATQGETQAQSQVASFRSAPPTLGDQPQSGSRDLAVRVAGEDELATLLQEELEAELSDGPTFGSVHELENPDSSPGEPALLVELPRRDLNWTPVYSTAEVTVEFVYGSDGDLSWRNDEVVGMSNEKGMLVRAKGEITLSDSARGLMSRRAYYGRVAGAIAAELDMRLEGSLTVPPGSVVAGGV